MKFLAAAVFLLISVVAWSQNPAEKLRLSRENTLKEIEYATKLLKETQGKAKQSLNEINIINHRLSKRKEYVTGLEVEVSVLDEEIERNLKDISLLEQEIKKIEKVYAAMITNLYKNKVSRFSTMYFLASNDLNQLYKRIYTVKLYNKYLRQEREKLDEMRDGLNSRNTELSELRSQKDLVLDKTRKEAIKIQQEINEKNKIVKQLKQRQKSIEEDIRNKERTAKKLENELKRIIEEEKKKSAPAGTRELLTPEERIVSTDFEKNTGKLPWPTQKGIITGRYGSQRHPDYKDVWLENDGIYITTSEGENARSVFKGTVARVFQIPGENYTVIIRHGQYFSMYHNLIHVKVKAGQVVNTKESIGTVYTDHSTRETVLYFQIWKDTQKNDPEIWLTPL